MVTTTSSEGAHVVRTSLSSDLVSAVVRMMTDLNLSPGERLDSQRNLADHFGVAVPTMREALRQLEGMGVLTFRHGSGIYVGTNFNRSVVPNAVAPAADVHRLVELVQARAILEPSVAARAAQMRDPEGLARLEGLIEEAADSLELDDGRLSAINVDIHRAIASATGNRIVEDVLDSLLLLHAEDQRRILVLHGDPHADLAEHRELVRLIVAGEVEEVTELMRRHLLDVATEIANSAGSGGGSNN
ncbi:FCD domain-containing protein [Georgenia sp. MJ173]|uniref:FadR/GntR family transcriptional regulator n=1 Tax=Georgenia sunbinii TaxID=3117728 RepID=UPI002F262101